jgi:hypothetical protein
MIMQDHSRRLREPLTWGRREKVAVATLVAAFVLATAALVGFALTSGGSPSRRDCIDITFASTVGAASEHACGARAQAICASPQAFRSSAQELRAACDRAGFRYGR